MGSNIKRLRRQRGWTQTDLAQRIGCTQGIITAYENNLKRPSLEKITQLAKVLDVSTDELIGHTQMKSQAAPKNPKLWKRFEQLQKLPPGEKSMVLKMIDGLLAHRG